MTKRQTQTFAVFSKFMASVSVIIFILKKKRKRNVHFTKLTLIHNWPLASSWVRNYWGMASQRFQFISRSSQMDRFPKNFGTGSVQVFTLITQCFVHKPMLESLIFRELSWKYKTYPLFWGSEYFFNLLKITSLMITFVINASWHTRLNYHEAVSIFWADLHIICKIEWAWFNAIL